MGNKKEKTKEDRILAEERKLKRIFKILEKDKLTIAAKLCKKAAFMDVTLDDMQVQITTEGFTKKAVNGNGFTVEMDHPALKSYNTMIKKLIDLLPEDTEEVDELLLHIRGKQ